MRLIVKPEEFAKWFAKAIPGAYRQITTDDVRDMTTCELIGKYGYYMPSDVEFVRRLLQYEQLQQNRQRRDEIRDSDGAIHCRRCDVVLAKPETRRGRPHEYCADCEPFRGRERNRKWRNKQDVMAMS